MEAFNAVADIVVLCPSQIVFELAVGFTNEGAVVTAMVTVAVALGQGDVPFTVYVYVPAVFVPGVNVPDEPPVSAEGPDHVPPEFGVPPNKENKFNAASFEQTVVLPFVPAVTAVFTVTVMVATDVAAQGAMPCTV